MKPMLTGIDPLLTGEVLLVLDAMGHGDALVIADANFPAESLGPRALAMQGVNATAALKAVLTVFPLDDVEESVLMGSPDGRLAIHDEFAALCAPHGSTPNSVDRHEFYAQASSAFAVIRTGEARPYGNIILYKGVVKA
jgi:L-fucose mutarotase